MSEWQEDLASALTGIIPSVSEESSHAFSLSELICKTSTELLGLSQQPVSELQIITPMKQMYLHDDSTSLLSLLRE